MKLRLVFLSVIKSTNINVLYIYTMMILIKSNSKCEITIGLSQCDLICEITIGLSECD